MARTISRLGDIFSAALNDASKKYFQYVANDMTQLNSSVIRVFKKVYPITATPDLESIVRDEIDFYAHVILKVGIKLKCWEKIGNVPEVGRVEVLFRDSGDYGSPQIKVSNDWWVWKINEPFVKVGKLEEKYQKAEIGIVVNPLNVLHRMRAGKYDFVYPGFK